jgi:hypothetical protein
LVPAAVRVTVWLPFAANAPVQLPDAVQPVALMVDQVSVVEPPTATVDEPRDMAGTASAVFACISP